MNFISHACKTSFKNKYSFWLFDRLGAEEPSFFWITSLGRLHFGLLGWEKVRETLCPAAPWPIPRLEKASLGSLHPAGLVLGLLASLAPLKARTVWQRMLLSFGLWELQVKVQQ